MAISSLRRLSRRRCVRLLALVGVALVGFALVANADGATPIVHSAGIRGVDRGAKADCIYSANSVAVLNSFERLMSHQFNCALVYNNSAVRWSDWERPWFLTGGDAASNWTDWVNAAGARRQLIISNNLFPSEVNGTDWLRAGAAGAYVAHARALARNLVAAGLGDSVIRLAHEANDTSYPYSIGTSVEDLSLWREFWRRTVIAMRSVPRAHFLFDWCINAYWRPIPLTEWYPGNDVVDIIGIDAYDSGVPAGMARWDRIYNQPDGIADVLRFASAHNKPLSIPEWGLAAPGADTLGGGDDPAYVDHIAEVVRHDRAAYQAYFFNLTSRTLLAENAASLAAYRRSFASHADAPTGLPITAG